MKSTHIGVIQSGWVFIGRMQKRDPKSNQVVLHGASCIRRWGTSMGLGELALNGPQKETVLEPCGILEAPLNAVLFFILVDGTKWPN